GARGARRRPEEGRRTERRQAAGGRADRGAHRGAPRGATGRVPAALRGAGGAGRGGRRGRHRAQTEGQAGWKTTSDLAFDARAGDGNRTRTASLEGWSSTIELHPHGAASSEFPLDSWSRRRQDYRLRGAGCALCREPAWPTGSGAAWLAR